MWEFYAFLSDRQKDKIVGQLWRITIDGEVIAEKAFDTQDRPEDTIVIDGVSYCSKPPSWEMEMDEWFAEQKTFAATFPSELEYAQYMNTALKLSD